MQSQSPSKSPKKANSPLKAFSPDKVKEEALEEEEKKKEPPGATMNRSAKAFVPKSKQ